MKTLFIPLFALSFLLNSCAVTNQEEETDPKTASFLQGESQSLNSSDNLNLRQSPDDIRYQTTIAEGQYHDLKFGLDFYSTHLSDQKYHDPVANWPAAHADALKTLTSLDPALDPKARLSRFETVGFLILDKYLNQVPVDESIAKATHYYLENLQDLGSKVELVLVATAFQRTKAFLDPDTQQKWTRYYQNLFNGELKKAGSNVHLEYAAKEAVKMITRS